MVKPQTLIDSLKRMTLGQAVRMVMGVAASLVLVWSSSGWMVKPLAAEVFNELLVGSEEFKTLQSQTEGMTKELSEIGRDADNIKKELSTLRNNLDQVSDQIEHTNKSIDKVEDLVGKLLTIQLQRADMSHSPPGTGPAGLPRLEALQ